MFISILEKLKNLKEIEIDCCFKRDDLFIPKILSLNISSCYISSDSTIFVEQADYFLSIVPFLKQLRNNNSNVDWNNSIVKYLKNQTTSKSSLKWLDLISVKNDSFLMKVLKIENLNLEYLVMKNFSRENEFEYLENLKQFISRQTNLTHLNVDLDLLQLSSIRQLESLKYLNVHLCYIDSEEPTSKFEKFWKLKVKYLILK